ncbi:MAG: hypothetical protein NC303_00590 [Firmicutes bacterium]|nr:hypothetical protein [Bacillota bacterium]
MFTNLISAEIVAQRVFNPLYIYLDSIFLVALMALLIIKRKYMTAIFGLFGGILYFIVDFGIFHAALHTRSIEGGDMAGVLFWMSMSYGITNFVWIWLWISRDEHKFTWTFFILVWWFVAPMLANAATGLQPIKIQRTTGSYHWVMALILVIGYFAAIIYNLFQKDKSKRFPLLWMLLIGVSVQLGWEASLLIGGIRSAEFDVWQKLSTLVVNSLLETNLGIVPIYCIYALITSRFTENLKRRDKVSFTARIAELNEIKIFNKDKNIQTDGGLS